MTSKRNGRIRLSSRRTARGSVALAIVLLAGLVSVDAAWAGCFADFKECVRAALDEEKWYNRGIMMADCELDLFQCVRGRIFG